MKELKGQIRVSTSGAKLIKESFLYSNDSFEEHIITQKNARFSNGNYAYIEMRSFEVGYKMLDLYIVVKNKDDYFVGLKRIDIDYFDSIEELFDVYEFEIKDDIYEITITKDKKICKNCGSDIEETGFYSKINPIFEYNEENGSFEVTPIDFYDDFDIYCNKCDIKLDCSEFDINF